MVSRRLAPVVSLVLVLGLSAPGVAADPSAAPGASPAPPAAVVLPGGTTTFGTYELVPLLTDDPPYAGPGHPDHADRRGRGRGRAPAAQGRVGRSGRCSATAS